MSAVICRRDEFTENSHVVGPSISSRVSPWHMSTRCLRHSGSRLSYTQSLSERHFKMLISREFHLGGGKIRVLGFWREEP